MEINKNGVIAKAVVCPSDSSNKKLICVCPLCGNEFEMWRSHFYRGSNACKCKNLKKNNPRLYRIWTNMKTRCNNPNVPIYTYYGGRGIRLCEEWNSFESFYKWATDNGYKDTLTLDRIDVNGNYAPGNCRWVGYVTQANNKRNNVIIVVGGKSESLKNICDYYGFNYKTEHTYCSRHGVEAETKRIMDKLMELEGEQHGNM